MKPKRPDSAKSRITQQTLDTQLNVSKFSQTFTSHSTFNLQKKDEFQKYLEEKDKDPKFKKFNIQPNLPQIAQRPIKAQGSKVNSKPFQKRTSSKLNSNPKIQQIQQKQKKATDLSQSQNNKKNNTLSKWTLNQPNITAKKQNKIAQQMTSSKSFAQKNKQKMNAISVGMKKTQNQTTKQQKKIDLKGFKVNVPGKKIKNNQEHKQNNKNQLLSKNSPEKQLQKQKVQLTKQQKKRVQKTQQQIKRQNQLLQISRFINDVQMKNIDYYPDGYQQFVQMNSNYMPQDLNLINIKDFLNQPTQKDYNKVQKRIQQNQRLLTQQQNMSISRISNISGSSRNNGDLSTQQTSIDLDKIIDGDSYIDQRRQHDNQIFLSSISAKDLKQRNLFLTQVLKGRVTKDQINKLQQMQKSQIKMIKLQDANKQDDDIEIMQINMMKKKSNRILNKNIIQASGQIYRDCDYLSQQNKLRLEKLLNGQVQQSPFQLSEWEKFAAKRLDEGIRLYRQFSASLGQTKKQEELSDDCLPKDPILRKQAQKKILKDKIDSINARLRQVDGVVINQTKIKALIQNYPISKISQSSQSMINQRNHQIDKIQLNKKLLIQLVAKAEKQKKQIQAVLRQMQKQYNQYQKDFKQFQKLSVAQIQQIQKNSLNMKKNRVQQIQKSINELQRITQNNLQQFYKDMQDKIQILKQIQNLKINNQILVENYHQNQTLQELDELFTKKIKEHPQRVIQKRTKQEKENFQQMTTI